MKNLYLLDTDKPSRLVLDSINNNLFLTTTKSFPSDIMKFKNIYITSDEEIKEGFYGLIGKEVGKIILTEEGYEFLIGKGVSYEYGDFHSLQKVCKKIILTTDQDLIKDGVQSIDDDFLNWFIKNPSCEWVWIKEKQHFEADKSKRKNPLNGVYYSYKIIIPEEEPNKTSYLDELPNMDKDVLLKMWESAIPKLKLKQETLEEVAEEFYSEQSKSYEDDIEPMFDTSRYLVAGFIEGAKWVQERSYSEEDLREAFRQGQDNVEYSEMYGFDSKLTEQEWFQQFKKK